MIYMDVDSALSEVPVNAMPLTDDTDFKSREESVAYNAAGMDLIWHFVTSAGAYSATAVTPTTGGDYDWSHQDGAMYTIEIPASGGASINNDTEGYGWFTGFATGVLPWRGPTITFRASGLNDLMVDSAYSATRGLAGTALPAAAADAAGGLVISDAGGKDFDAMHTTIAQQGGTGGGLSAIPWNSDWDAEVESEALDALISINMDHLLALADSDDVVDDSVMAKIASSTADWSTLVSSTDSLQAIRDRGDAAWAGGGSNPLTLASGTIGSTGNSTTALHLTGLTQGNDELNGFLLIITDDSASEVHSRWIDDWVLSTEIATVATLPFTPEDATDTYTVVGIRRDVNTTQVEGLDATDQIRDAVVDDATRIDASALNTASNAIGADGAGLTEAGGDGDHLVEAGGTGDQFNALPWNSAWDAEVQSECTDALNAYDPPTRTEATSDKDAILTRLGTPADTDVSTDIASLQTDSTAILADTNELQSDDVPGLIATAQADLDVITGASGVNLLTATQASIDAIEADTGTTLPATLAAIQADLPVQITKNVELAAFPFKMVDATDGYTAETSISVTAQRSIDGAAFGACANSVSEIGNGWYKITLAAADLNGDTIILRFTGTGCRETAFTLVTQPS